MPMLRDTMTLTLFFCSTLSCTHAHSLSLPLIAVQKSKCPSYVGTRGIVLQETQNTFRLISEEDRLKSK